MGQKRIERASALIQKLAAEFIERNINPVGVLATVTWVELKPAMKDALIFVSVWPESRGEEVMGALESSKKEFYEYMKENFKIKYMPSFRFRLDEGERARQKIEEILQKNK